MILENAIMQACSEVGIIPPKARRYGRWLQADTLDGGKRGKGDGRVILDPLRVTAWNWRTGEKATVWVKDRGSLSPVEKKKLAERRKKDEAARARQAKEAASKAAKIVADAKLSTHPYLAAKGFRDEKFLTLDAKAIRGIAGWTSRTGDFVPPDYLIAGDRALVIPARIGTRITSVQLIWEDGTKKFLAGGEFEGASHRIATGRDTWLCEGLATGFSLRAALKSLNRTDTVLCCFSASNVAAVAKTIKGRCFIVTDHDKPLPQFGGLGTGEYWARAAGKPYAMPPESGDVNDMHMRDGIFAVQRLIVQTIREATQMR